MTMHLEGPWLSMTGKRKGKKKFASAEHARKARELDKEWKELQKRWGVEEEERKRKRALSAEPLVTTPKVYIRDTGPKLPSRGDGMGVAVKKEAPVYTGTKIKGIGTMHKSNAVPIFTDDEAKDISSMRR